MPADVDSLNWIKPDWPAPDNVRALSTSRLGGVSSAPFDELNLGDHVGDDPQVVQQNRQCLRDVLQLPAEPLWLEQVHGVEVYCPTANGSVGDVPRADASVVRVHNQVAVIMTADCLPVLFCDAAGTRVAAAHAGWRGLCNGVLEYTVEQLDCEPGEIMAWLGPAIGPEAFEVGSEVRAAFMEKDARAATAFKAGQSEGKYLADIYQLARQRLDKIGVEQVYGGGFCTFTDSKRFFSYRRESRTGRMASLIWMA